ncbi:MAG: hypothetical protein AAGI23_13945 [Bacteroidota bacterium]
MLTRLMFVCVLISFVQLSFAQRKVLHKTVETKEAAEINLDLVGNVKVEAWAGNVVMTETTVLLENAAASVLQHFIDNGRYDIAASDPDSSVVLVLTSLNKDREAVSIRRWIEGEQVQVDVIENVETTVFIPEEFVPQDDEKTVWKLKPEFLKDTPTPIDTTMTSKSGTP